MEAWFPTTYYIKVDNSDNLGVVTSITQTVVVSRQLETVSVKIFNEAGEEVRTLTSTVADAQGTQLNLTQLTSTVIQPGSPTQGQLGIILSNGVTLNWDGHSDGGQIVTNGEYYLEIHVSNGNNQVWAAPNSVVDGASPVTFTVNAADPQNLTVRVYDVAGELVTTVKGDPGASTAVWKPGNVASGLYIAVAEAVETSSNHLTVRQTVKVLVRH